MAMPSGLAKWMMKNKEGAKLLTEKAGGARSGFKEALKANPKKTAAAIGGGAAAAAAGVAMADDGDDEEPDNDIDDKKPKKKKRPYLED